MKFVYIATFILFTTLLGQELNVIREADPTDKEEQLLEGNPAPEGRKIPQVHFQAPEERLEDEEEDEYNPSSQQIFDRVDSNANGVLERMEFKQYLQRLHEALVPAFLPKDDDRASSSNVEQSLLMLNFWPGFTRSLGTIWATEIGDKTFFIAAILSMRHDRLVVYVGAIGALAAMTVLSVLLGSVVSLFLPPYVTHYIGMCLFLLFGLKMLQESQNMLANAPSEELAEVEEELLARGKKADESLESGTSSSSLPTTTSSASNNNTTTTPFEVISQSFLLTFIAEWGDRSQIATITLSTTNNPWAVNAGAILGHAMCTGLAVLGGKVLATRISEKTVTWFGGIIFLIFALHSLLTGPPMA